jgi:hypothetical protein
MFSSANEYGRASTLDSRAAVDRARALLETALTTSGEDIRAVARHFERLAHEVQNVLDLTSGIVNCVQQDWVVSIVPSARALASSARRFIEERIDSLAAISTVFTSEAKMLETLLSLTTEQRFIAREGETLAVLASIEVARLAAEGRRFEYMARELAEFSAMVSCGAAEVQSEAQKRRKTFIERRRKLQVTIQRRTEHFDSIEAELSAAIVAMDAALVDFARIPADFQNCVALVAANISRVVEAVQVQDITRQQTEHVRDMLIRTSDKLKNCDRQDDNSLARRNAILKVQAHQIQSACASTKEWIDEVNQCLESILHVGSSDVLAIGATILEQERGLSLQVARIERLENECAADDVEIEASLASIGELMRITKNHLMRSRQARERMQLLNFNSMIEARHLGDQAMAVLEVTRNIGRVSTEWSRLTDRSGDTLEAMLSSSARAEDAHRTRTRLSMENLGSARHDSDAGLAALSRAAAIADTNGGKIKAAVTAMHDESTTLALTAGRLTYSVALMEDACNEIQNANEVSAGSAALLTWDDRVQIENECAATYSSELERRILRAVLDGDEMPVLCAAVMGNDVELF